MALSKGTQIGIGAVVIGAVAFLIFSSPDEGVLEYVYVDKVVAAPQDFADREFKVHGNVVEGTLTQDETDDSYHFVIEFKGERLQVVYDSLLPDTFVEGGRTRGVAGVGQAHQRLRPALREQVAVARLVVERGHHGAELVDEAEGVALEVEVRGLEIGLKDHRGADQGGREAEAVQRLQAPHPHARVVAPGEVAEGGALVVAATDERHRTGQRHVEALVLLAEEPVLPELEDVGAGRVVDLDVGLDQDVAVRVRQAHVREVAELPALGAHTPLLEEVGKDLPGARTVVEDGPVEVEHDHRGLRAPEGGADFGEGRVEQGGLGHGRRPDTF